MKDLTHNSEDPECHNKDFVCLNKDHSQKNAQNNKKPNKQTNAQNSKQTERKSLKWPAFLQTGSLELRRKETGRVYFWDFTNHK